MLVLCYVVIKSGLWSPLLAGALVLGFWALRQTYDDHYTIISSVKDEADTLEGRKSSLQFRGVVLQQITLEYFTWL